MGTYLNEEKYAAVISPSLTRWFSSNDREMRITLLENLESFVQHIPRAIVNDKVFPSIINGFTDTSTKLKELTIRSMVVLAPLLSEDKLNKQLLSHFARLQVDKSQYVRANTTICLGRISAYLSEATRKRVLVAAFRRSLKDPFPPARVAALMSFSATHQFYEPEIVARHIIPEVSPLLVDSNKDVSTAAIKAMKIFVNKLDTYIRTGETMAAIQEEPAKGEGIIGWAFGALTKKIYTTPTTAPVATTNDTAPVQKEGLPEKEAPRTGTKTLKAQPISHSLHFSSDEDAKSGGEEGTEWGTGWDSDDDAALENPNVAALSAGESNSTGWDDSIADGWDDSDLEAEQVDGDLAATPTARTTSKVAESRLAPIISQAPSLNAPSTIPNTLAEAGGWEDDDNWSDESDDWGLDAEPLQVASLSKKKGGKDD
eukprot:TRINITY_DN6463_c0_g1_i1.p1 TRINITY_DN6463_c0_g1~~TRINITY_DN6463_c0_g1_i1.p1  ORF type:complete len:439 (-),score=91.99 TRINITY_DN6463_c0_g1_i1:77-1360(-)